MMFFVLVCMLLMVFSGGMAIDIMRYESDRMKVQSVADSAVLAAASMRRFDSAQDIVEDWFAKAGIPEALREVRAQDTGLNFRDVYAEIYTATRPYFMQMMGINLLHSEGEARAIETRSNVEISMVLDVSGSMQKQSRDTNLKLAAKEFVQEILTPENVERTLINIVPYNGQVMLSDGMWSRHTITNAHNRPASTTRRQCLDFPQSAYGAAPISLNAPHSQAAYVDTFQYGYNEDQYRYPPNTTQSPQAVDASVVWCTGSKANAIRLGSSSAAVLNSTIENLVFTGATSIDLGLKWGASLLDPISKPLFQALGDPQFNERPAAYDDPMTLKVIVLMTDGEHFEHEYLKDEYKAETLSPVYRYSSNNGSRYLIHHPTRSGSDKYWVPSDSKWVSRSSSMGSATQLTWPQLFSEVRLKWVAWQLYSRALGGNDTQRLSEYNKALDQFRFKVSTKDMDARLISLCRQARQKNVVIFGIAFEAPPGGQNVMRECASPGRYYDVAGLDIRTAFRAIRMQIQALRLTQ